MARSVNGPYRRIFSYHFVESDPREDRYISLPTSPPQGAQGEAGDIFLPLG
jgi:hypothetical protein